MHVQKAFIIIAFSETLVEKTIYLLGAIPWIGNRLREPFKAFLQNQKARLHRSRADSAEAPEESKNFLAEMFEYFVFAMILYFVVSIVNSLAQSYHKRIHKKPSSKDNKQKEVLNKKKN